MKTPNRKRQSVTKSGRPQVYTSNAARQMAYRKRKKRFVLFRHGTDEWETPPDLFATLNSEFGFTIDLAATTQNALCPLYFDREADALKQKWEGVCWLNPPFGTPAKGADRTGRPAVGRWVQKAHESAREGATVVCLLAARTDAHWWHDHVIPFAEIRYIRGRLKFRLGESTKPSRATFPSVIAVFRPGATL
jgi:phage N-6-adenine-methyltransferase